MFINSKKSFEIREGANTFTIPRNFIGLVPDWVASHWLIQAAIKDGSIATPENSTDRSLEEADKNAEGKAEKADLRPEDPDAVKLPSGQSKDKLKK